MTAIAIWLNNENPENSTIWVACDSRVSSRSQNSTLIDDGAKIFTLPIVCRSPDKYGDFSHICYYHTYGYCFAGSTLLGQNTFLALMPLLSNLAAAEPYIPPMINVAAFILQYLSRSFDEYKVIACENSAIEVALFGWCHATQKHCIFHYYPDLDENGVFIIKCTQHTDLQSKYFIYMGDFKDKLTYKIQEAFNGEDIPGKPISRIPRYIIEEYIQNSIYKSIGGDLQLGIANSSGFNPRTICRSIGAGRTEVSMSYLGYELYQDIQNVGNAFVNLTGMFG